ncbi:MAG: hypothetical protein CM15mV41_1120 [Caudoviricetes sp.]|nr:MAG: hypothetical protein CM15mV41_1120 [Caudoviricetes sp.]
MLGVYRTEFITPQYVDVKKNQEILIVGRTVLLTSTWATLSRVLDVYFLGEVSGDG